MTDAHCHVARGAERHFICDPMDGAIGGRDVRFAGTHPWFLDGFDAAALRARLAADPALGVGETGLDRLRERVIPQRMRDVFDAQLALAAEFRRPVVLHGAKCWGEVVKAAAKAGAAAHGGAGVPAFLFHGFSRSEGLLPDIIGLNGYVSVGPSILNDHAVNYRALVKKIPSDRLLVESDATAESAAEAPGVEEVFAKLAEVRGEPLDALAVRLEANADAFASHLVSVKLGDLGARQG